MSTSLLTGFAADHTRTGRQLGFRAVARELRRMTIAELDDRREATNRRATGTRLAVTAPASLLVGSAHCVVGHDEHRHRCVAHDP